ncbi:arylesterase [Polaribacter glomeratus]|uniref:Arylesterase n=1 Tax=Polaribacter glomeratus TaxID=102 RepID=A0A2S7WW13_9FLAO|nr:arylesterase [Polaribacter glomeratus]PQJ81758.1 arylesterase [Polaribacter glomeratus]TXD66317.1 arylesterase [Polaribacter glomeratus]
MLRLKNKQLNLNSTNTAFNVFIKLCYFSSMILLLSCGSDTSKKEDTTETAPIKTEITGTAKSTTKKILFFGDSLTAGYGLEDVNDAFPALIQSKIDSLSLKYMVLNAGLSGETTAGGKSRINWVLNNQNIDIFVLELGANDGLRGVPLKETRENLQAIIDAVLKKNPSTRIVLAGMQLPPNMGIDYATEFKSIFPYLANKNELQLIPFLLKDVGGVTSLNQADGIHPTVKGHKMLAKNAWEVLKPMIIL